MLDNDRLSMLNQLKEAADEFDFETCEQIIAKWKDTLDETDNG